MLTNKKTYCKLFTGNKWKGCVIMYKIISALGGEYIRNKLLELGYEIFGDIDNQEMLFKYLSKKSHNVLILSDRLPGFYSKYGMIKKIRDINKKIKIVVILEEDDEGFKKYLINNGVSDFFNNGKFSLEDVISRIEKYENEDIKKTKNIYLQVDETEEKEEKSLLSLNSQNIFAVFGNTGAGKSLFTYLYSKYLAEVSGLKILILDFDTEKGDINLLFNLPNVPKYREYELPDDKNSSLNYLVDMIDKGIFTEYNFENCLIKDKNVDIIPGNTSLNVCLNTMVPSYYEKILEMAKVKFDLIFLDMSSSLFLDSTQFSVCNATDIFFLIEANKVSVERCKRTLREICENWDIDKKKIKILVNKYKSGSMEKELIKQLLREYEVIGFLPFCDAIEANLNDGTQSIPRSIKEEFRFLSSDMGLTRKITFMDKLFLK